MKFSAASIVFALVALSSSTVSARSQQSQAACNDLEDLLNEALLECGFSGTESNGAAVSCVYGSQYEEFAEAISELASSCGDDRVDADAGAEALRNLDALCQKSRSPSSPPPPKSNYREIKALVGNGTTPPSPQTRPPPNYALLVKWSSPSTAWIFLTTTILMTVGVLYNLIVKAKTLHSRTVYVYLLLWCMARITAFAMRGYILSNDNGLNYGLYQWSSIVASLGFMPLAEAMSVVTIESSAMVYGMKRTTAKYLDIAVKVAFLLSGTCVAAFVIDYTLNDPFGSNVKDFAKDLALREIGFNGLILLTLYTLVGSTFNLIDCVRKMKVPSEFWGRFRTMCAVTIFQSLLILVKLVYTAYRNWNPSELRDESIWYGVSVLPEYVFMLFYCTHYFLQVFDDIELKHGKYSHEEQKWVKTAGEDEEASRNADGKDYKAISTPDSFK
ncbi:hypothetical protein BC830DRAFT_1102219 [Chytriomyces sp. MP71]|nr:hypothetical protein BC830DRAFT_1102219 [Chytriomyces sp. MP71]